MRPVQKYHQQNRSQRRGRSRSPRTRKEFSRRHENASRHSPNLRRKRYARTESFNSEHSDWIESPSRFNSKSPSPELDFSRFEAPYGKDWHAPEWHPFSPFYGMSWREKKDFIVRLEQEKEDTKRVKRNVEMLPRLPYRPSPPPPEKPLKSSNSKKKTSVLVQVAPSANKKPIKFFDKNSGHKKFFTIGQRAKHASIKLQSKMKEFKKKSKKFSSVDCESDLQRSMFFRLKLKSKSNQYDMLKDMMDVYIEFFGEIAEDIMKEKLKEKKEKRKKERKGKVTEEEEEKEQDNSTGPPTDKDNALMEAIASGQVEEKEIDKMIEDGQE